MGIILALLILASLAMTVSRLGPQLETSGGEAGGGR